jgi:conjugative transposon TraN protein
MKKLQFFLLLIILTVPSLLQAQVSSPDLPPFTMIPHFHLSVSYNTTTVLIFAADVKPIDRGDRDVIAQKQPGTDNVLKLKAARRNFPPTNLHVFTPDGHFFAFDITYTDSLASTHDLTALPAPSGSALPSPTVYLTNQPLNDQALQGYIAKMLSLPYGRIASSTSDRMTFRLEDIGLTGKLMFFRFHIQNKSALDYTPDFIRIFMEDRKKAARSSIQEQEITPLYTDPVKVIHGNTSLTYVLAVPAFTLSRGKRCTIEAYETGGGRILKLYLSNKDLFHASKL